MAKYYIISNSGPVANKEIICVGVQLNNDE
jgi:hypothetical protein